MDRKNSSTIRAIDGISDLNSSLEELFSSGTSQATGISAVSRHKSLTQLLYVMASFNGLEDDEEQMKVFVMANMLASLNHMVPKRMFGYITTLRRLAQGRATPTTTPSPSAPVPAEEMKVLVG